MRNWVFVFALLALVSCGKRESPQELAAHVQIQANAPIKCTVQITINAPPAKVWGILSDIADWPKWQSDITQTALGSPAGPGALFSWTSGGTSVHSAIQLFQPDQSIAWTGRVLNFHAIHVWTLAPLPDGGTLVTTTESMNGWLITFFYSSAELLQSDQRWLNALKVAAEH